MRKLIWSEKSASDLDEIYDYISIDSQFYASLQVERIAGSVERLANHPLSGRILPEFPNLPYREIICGAYRVIYRIDKDSEQIIIVTIAHSARLISRIIVP
ncbi:MAG: type II toxin-antitoxin system RelE/ParE family toxin [Desulfuromonadales bacterium]